jgi:7-cyano-7-deazaguanine synthase in queuosine biosynthesis
MKEYAFFCGGANEQGPGFEENVIRLDVAGPDRNVNLRLTDFSRALVTELPDLLVDLLELAAYVYCADQRASRGSLKLSNAGEDWRRRLRFVVPVRCRDTWESATVRKHLAEVLGYLSDDIYEFEFLDSSTSADQVQSYFPEGPATWGGFDAEDIVLFSGGIDSLTGTVESLAAGKRLVLVSHHSASKVVSVQKDLVQEFRARGFGSQIFHVTINVTNVGVEPVEPTQRSRSFLFASLAFVVSHMFLRDGFTFYENGIVSLNLPIAADVVGARATRTTHPRVIRGFEQFFASLIGRPIAIESPYLWFTRKEVIERLGLTGLGDLLGKSVSCVHPISWTTAVRHCGTCSQCIDRRFGVLAAGAEDHDVVDGYGIDLLTGDRRFENIDPSIAYVKFARAITRVQRAQFQSEFPQVSAALHHVPGLSAGAVLDRIWGLHQRHAYSVLSVIADAARHHADDLAAGNLPPGSLLSLCFTHSRIEAVGPDTAAATAAFIDRLSTPTCYFAVDESGKKICFSGDFLIEGAGFRLILALLFNHREAKRRCEDIPFFWTDDLAVTLELEETALRRQVVRLRQLAESRLAVDLGVIFPNGFIENQRAKGYRLSPELREVSLADLRTDVTHRIHHVTNGS